MPSRRAFLGGLATAAAATPACSPSLVRRVENGPLAPDPRGVVLVVIDFGRSRYGPVYVGSQQQLAGICVPLTHFVTLLPPGKHFIIAYDDESYDAAEADLAPLGIYAIELVHSGGELEIRPLVPGRDPIRRLLDETDRVALAHTPKREAMENYERKVRLAHLRYADYSARKRQTRAIGPEHMWR